QNSRSSKVRFPRPFGAEECNGRLSRGRPPSACGGRLPPPAAFLSPFGAEANAAGDGNVGRITPTQRSARSRPHRASTVHFCGPGGAESTSGACLGQQTLGVGDSVSAGGVARV